MRDKDCIEASDSDTEFMRGFWHGIDSANEVWRVEAIRQAASNAALDSAIKAAWPHGDQNSVSDYDKGRIDAAEAIRALKSNGDAI